MGKEVSTRSSVALCESGRTMWSSLYSQQVSALPSSPVCGHSLCVLLPVRPALAECELTVVSSAPGDEVVVVFGPCSGVWTTASLPQLESSVGGQAGHLSGGARGHEGRRGEWDTTMAGMGVSVAMMGQESSQAEGEMRNEHSVLTQAYFHASSPALFPFVYPFPSLLSRSSFRLLGQHTTRKPHRSVASPPPYLPPSARST